MTGSGPLLDEVRRLVVEDASVPALRAGLFLLGFLAAMAWLQRAPRLASGLIATGAALGLCYWMIQISSPLGLGTDAALTRQWAQAGVNASAEPKGMGFVWGTAPEHSLVSVLASVGVPLQLVLVAPQLAVFLGLSLLILLPWALIKNPRSAALAASLAVGGGLWPGLAPYNSLLLHPSLVVAASAAFAVVLLARCGRGVRRTFDRLRVAVSIGLVALAALDQAGIGGAEPGTVAALLLAATTIVLVSRLRAAIRRASRSHGAARRIEAILVLATFSGSGLLWWNPPQTAAGFVEARGSGAALRKPLWWIARNVPAGDVVFASAAYSAPIAALAGRRVLFPPPDEAAAGASLPEPFRRTRLSVSILGGRPIARLAEAFSVTHLFLGPGETTPLPADQIGVTDEPRLHLVLVYRDVQDFRVFRLAKQ